MVNCSKLLIFVCGKLSDGELSDGELSDGELFDGELSDGELSDGELSALLEVQRQSESTDSVSQVHLQLKRKFHYCSAVVTSTLTTNP